MTTPTPRAFGRAALILMLMIAMPGCFERELAPLEPCLVSAVSETIGNRTIDEIDLLFLVDDSSSMLEEQQALAREFPELVRVLASGDLDGDGTEDFAPVKSLRLGVISSDMGHGGFPQESDPETNRLRGTMDDRCSSERGKDGVLLAPEACGPTAQGFLEYGSDSDQTPEDFGNAFGCLASVGAEGCGFEMQLEATLKALTPSNSGLTFYGDTPGHGAPSGANTGFLREGSLLAIVLVTDEDDCATFDYGMFTYESGESPNLTCAKNREALLSVQRYVDGLRALRDDPQLLVFAAITGVEPPLVASYGETCETDQECGEAASCRSGRCAQDFQALLDHPTMEERADPDRMGNYLVPSCRRPHFNDGQPCSGGESATTTRECGAVGASCIGGLCRATQDAYPPRRIVEVAKGLEEAGSNGIITSICQDDFKPALSAIVRKLADVLKSSCLPRPLNRGGDRLVRCEVRETLPAGDEAGSRRCEDLPGRSAAGSDPMTGAPICLVRQVTDASSGPGWYYDDSSPELKKECAAGRRQRIVFTEDARPPSGATLTLECLQPIQTTEITIGLPCDPAADLCTSGDDRAPKYGDMFCEPTSRTCQVRCESDADCHAKGLGPHVCDTREGRPRICVNPTCQY